MNRELKKIVILNGPNLNLIGQREPEIYGSQTFSEYFEELKKQFEDQAILHYLQSNVEGELINYIQEHGFDSFAIVLNPGAYAHTSVAIADAIAAITTPVIEVHISNIFAREPFRHKLITASKCKGTISGFGLQSYFVALKYLLE
jgi:3-dehydroquinate dehydratase II